MCLLHAIYLTLSSFVFFQEQYFRYYAFYLFCSFGVFYALWFFAPQYESKRAFFWGALLLAPFMHVFLAWQIGWYILIREIGRLSFRGKIIFAAMGGLCGATLGLMWHDLMAGVLRLVSSEAQVTGAQLRGVSLGLVVKPIYAAFQFVFGYDVEPTESPVVMLLFASFGLAFIYRLVRVRKEDPELFVLVVSAAVVPLLTMHYLLEPLTLPGSTQFESKHALFCVPLMLSVFVPRAPERAQALLLGALLVLCTGMGTWSSLSSPRPDWERVIDMATAVNEKNGIVLVDGRAKDNLLFYADGKLSDEDVVSINEWHSRTKAISDVPALLLVTNDWKSYQMLSVAQNWNTGSSTEERYDAVSTLFEFVRKSGKICTDSFGLYPLYALSYEDPAEEGLVSQPKPGFFGLPHKDIRLPIQRGDFLMSGCQKLTSDQAFELRNRTPGTVAIYHFIESRRPIASNTFIGTIGGEHEFHDLILAEPPADDYGAMFARALEGSEQWYTWRKRPVITQSLRYPGSFLPSRGYVYSRTWHVRAESRIELNSNEVVLNLCGVDLRPDPEPN
jgi:hypothetical protein